MEACLTPAVDRYNALSDDDKNEFLNVLTPFRNLYAFMSQIIPFQDSDLEKLYAFVRFLSKRLERSGKGEAYELGDDVALKYYRERGGFQEGGGKDTSQTGL
jgi:type I restriction enzyme R subunit